GLAWYPVPSTSRRLRTYRVSRIERAAVLDTPCERPPDFDLAAVWKASAEQFERRTRFQTRLRLEPGAAKIVKSWCRVRSNGSDGRARPDGWIDLDVDFDDEDSACFVVLGLGGEVR